MNAVLSLCHFCEIHGPRVLISTQPSRPHCANTLKDRKFYGPQESLQPSGFANSSCEVLCSITSSHETAFLFCFLYLSNIFLLNLTQGLSVSWEQHLCKFWSRSSNQLRDFSISVASRDRRTNSSSLYTKSELWGQPRKRRSIGIQRWFWVWRFKWLQCVEPYIFNTRFPCSRVSPVVFNHCTHSRLSNAFKHVALLREKYICFCIRASKCCKQGVWCWTECTSSKSTTSK